jgi:predicted neutral ceramidase superfamily lipid hydrolase
VIELLIVIGFGVINVLAIGQISSRLGKLDFLKDRKSPAAKIILAAGLVFVIYLAVAWNMSANPDPERVLTPASVLVYAPASLALALVAIFFMLRRGEARAREKLRG